jgi:hypothetical protein
MLKDLVRPANATIASRTYLSPSGTVIKPLPMEPGEPDLNEYSIDNLATLADVAYRSGDRASAEAIVRRLYAEYDRRHAEHEHQQMEACQP